MNAKRQTHAEKIELIYAHEGKEKIDEMKRKFLNRKRKYTIKDFINNVQELLYSGVKFYRKIPIVSGYMDNQQKESLKNHIRYVINILEEASEALDNIEGRKDTL